MSRFSVVIPVKDGARFLDEVLAAVMREGPGEVLVVDSGSRDGSPAIARRAGADVLEVEPREFAHGRTRNLAAERTRGELICFLTQDATPCEGWLAAYEEAFALDERIGAAYGPHLPRPETSPMVARELEEFFATFSPDGRPRVQGPGDHTFLSNVNACYARRCWEEIRFRDIAYAEDQAFGIDLLARGWLKAYHPGAAVLHAHDYGLLEFMRRYFDEYRGLNLTLGHVERLGIRSTVTHVRRGVSADRRWMAEHGIAGLERARWTARSAAHHGGRKLFSALGSRAERMPPRLRRALSLERGDRPDLPPHAAPAAPDAIAMPSRGHALYEESLEVLREGPAPLLDVPEGLADRARLRIAMVIPPFRRGSGGHNTLMQILLRLERRGHLCTVWVHDHTGELESVWPAVLRRNIREYFAPIEGPVYKGFGAWHGADVVIATGWQTVHPVLRLPGCRARAYLVNDLEPEFYGASTERALAEDTYRHGLHCIAASPWLRDVLRERYGASADAFQLGVDHDTYHPRAVPRRRDSVVYYARPETARRAVPTGLLALAELRRRRPELQITLFGTRGPVLTPFDYRHAGILDGEGLARLYSSATVGLCLSLSNFSLMPKEMLACGLPCVELAGVSAESIFGEDGPIELAPLNPLALADAMERLITDQELWERRSREGIAFVSSHTWEQAADEVEAGLRHALRERERAAAAQP